VPNGFALRFFGGFVPWVIDGIAVSRFDDANRYGYRESAEADAPTTHTFRYWPGTHVGISYGKTALWLHTLERHLGWPVLQRAMATYFDRWKFRHPQPTDLFAVVNEASGQDLSWLVETYRSSNVLDYGIQSFSSARAGDRYRTVVVVQRLGEAVFPVEVVTTFRDGQRMSERWDGRDRRVIYTYERMSEALTAHVDPGRVLMLDMNYTNNSATLTPRAREAGLKWGLTWLVWLQELLLTYAFFV
jgi:hypothetical protein